jgi:hypothetical protein
MSRADRRARARAQARRRQQTDARRRGGASILSPKIRRIITIVLVVSAVLGAGAWWGVSYVAGNKTVKAVNGQVITQREVDLRVRMLMFLYGMKKVSAETRQAVIDSMVEEELVRAEIDKRGLSISQEDLDRLTKQYSEALTSLYGSNLNITTQRLRLRVPAQALIDYQRSQIRGTKLYEAVTAAVTVTEADIQAAYAANKEALDQQGLSLDQVRDRLAQDALGQKRGETYSQFLKDLQSAATITGPG